MKRLIHLSAAILFLTAAYVYAWPSANVPYFAAIVIHLVTGIIFLILLTWTLAHTPPFPGGVADWLDSAGLWRRARNRFGFYRHAARGVASAVHSYWSVRDGRSHAFFRLGRQTRLARERNSRWRGPQRDLCDCGGADCVWRVLAAHRSVGTVAPHRKSGHRSRGDEQRRRRTV